MSESGHALSMMTATTPRACEDCRFGDCEFSLKRVRLYLIVWRQAKLAGEPLDLPPLTWSPELSDLTPEARQIVEQRAPRGSARGAFIAGVVWAWYYADQRDMFTDWQGPS